MRRKERCFKTILIMLIMALILMGCMRSLDKEMIGAWDVISNDDDNATFIINENNTLMVNYSVFSLTFNYEIDNKNKTITIWEDTENAHTYKVKRKNDSFILKELDQEKPEILKLTKQNQ